MKTRIVIPARLESSRLPKKLIKKINGKTLIEHVFTRAKKIKCDSLVIATDNRIIKDIAESSNMDCWFSRKSFLNGTHRISALSDELKYKNSDIVINIQADEFNFPISGVSRMINYMKRQSSINVTTLIFKNNNKNIFNDKNMVKVAIDTNNQALIFTRSPIPYNGSTDSYIHIGIYGYRVSILKKYSQLNLCPYEKSEKLEQLRFLWNNIKIKCLLLKQNSSLSINTLKDLKMARSIKK